MESNQIPQADYLDLIFENRNKSYGGYTLRKHYNNRALKALGITLALILFISALPVMLKWLEHTETLPKESPQDTIVHLAKIAPPVQPVIPPPEASAPKAVAATIKNPAPVIARDNIVKPEHKPPAIDELKDKLSGPVHNEGQPDGTEMARTEKISSHTGGNGAYGQHKGKSDTGMAGNKEPAIFVEQMPEFPGGEAALIAFINKNLHYPTIAREEGIAGKVTLSFVVGTNGEIESAKVLRGIGGGCDKEALRVVNAMPKWKAGRQNGHAVKVFFTLPISFQLQ